MRAPVLRAAPLLLPGGRARVGGHARSSRASRLAPLEVNTRRSHPAAGPGALGERKKSWLTRSRAIYFFPASSLFGFAARARFANVRASRGYRGESKKRSEDISCARRCRRRIRRCLRRHRSSSEQTAFFVTDSNVTNHCCFFSSSGKAVNNAPAYVASRDTRAFDCGDADTPCVPPPGLDREASWLEAKRFEDNLDSMIEVRADTSSPPSLVTLEYKHLF